jgi:hypothetical protein
MSNRSIITLSALFAIILVAGVFMYQRDKAPHAVNAQLDPLSMRQISTGTIDAIRVSSADGTETALRTNGSWQVNGEAIDTTTIDTFLSGLATAQESLVSHKARETATYGLGQGQTKTLTLSAGTNEVASYDIGTTDYRTGGVYVVRKGEDDAYLVHSTSFPTLANAQFASWIAATSTATSTTTSLAPAAQ